MTRGYSALVLLSVGCAGHSATTTSSTDQQQANRETAACAYPSGIETDASATDTCIAGPPGQICQVSNGATIDEDGGVENGTETCRPQCAGSQYQLTCSSSALQAPIPAPDEQLGCTIIAGPTLPDELLYCCPCATEMN